MRLHPACLLLALFLAAPATAKDPTRPPSPAEIQAWYATGAETTGADSEPWTLQSVLISDSRRVAVIDGQRVRVGDAVDDATVAAIEPGHVELTRRGETITLTIDKRLPAVRPSPSN